MSLLSCFILDRISYSPYGGYAHNLSIFSSFFVFHTLFPIIFNKKILNIYILPFIGLNWIYFQSPLILKEKTIYFPRVILAEHIPDIAFYSCASIVMIYIGYFFVFNTIQPITSKNLTIKNTTLKKLVYFFVAISIAYQIGLSIAPFVTSSLSNIIQILFYSPIIASALYGLYLMRTKSYPSFTFFHVSFILFFLLELLYNISTTMFVSTALLFSGVILVYYYEKKKIPVAYLLVISFLLVPFYLTRTYYRTVKKPTDNTTSQIEKGGILLEKIYNTEDDDSFNKYSNRIESNDMYKKNRFENLSFIGQVVYYHTKRHRPFYHGSTFYWLPLVPIPRVIFPSKPENVMATTMSESYGLRGKGSNAAINFPMLVEAYINFGFLGMPVMALFFGISFKWFVMKYGIGLGDINILIIINCFKQLIHAEGNITLVFGALIQIFIFWFLLLKLLKIDKNLTSI